MAGTTGIAWTDATCNFWIGCTKVGPGCDGCYAEVFANRKFNITFGPGERRHRTMAGYENPRRWQRMHDRGQATMQESHAAVPVPRWVFCNSLSDFFDNEIPPEWRADAWEVIRNCPALRWQIVTKRVGNVAKMLPTDWRDGADYQHVGIIATMVNQPEFDRDVHKLSALKRYCGARWIGASIEPQLEAITLRDIPLDWVITGGESKQGDHPARPYNLEWPRELIRECAVMGSPVFVKQMGDHPIQFGGRATKFGQAGSDPSKWPADLRVQQMPRVFDRDAPYQPRNIPAPPAPKPLSLL